MACYRLLLYYVIVCRCMFMAYLSCRQLLVLQLDASLSLLSEVQREPGDPVVFTSCCNAAVPDFNTVYYINIQTFYTIRLVEGIGFRALGREDMRKLGGCSLRLRLSQLGELDEAVETAASGLYLGI